MRIYTQVRERLDNNAKTHVVVVEDRDSNGWYDVFYCGLEKFASSQDFIRKNFHGKKRNRKNLALPW